jgi:hypothetical protein
VPETKLGRALSDWFPTSFKSKHAPRHEPRYYPSPNQKKMEGEEVMSQHFGAYDSQETQDLYNNGLAPRRSPRKSPIKPVQPTEKKRKFKWLGGGMFNNPLFRGQFIYVLRSIVSNKQALLTYGNRGHTWITIHRHCTALTNCKGHDGQELDFSLMSSDRTLSEQFAKSHVDAERAYGPQLEGPRATGDPRLGVTSEWEDLWVDYLKLEKSLKDATSAAQSKKQAGADILERALMTAAEMDDAQQPEPPKSVREENNNKQRDEEEAEYVPNMDEEGATDEEAEQSGSKKATRSNKRKQRSPAEKNDMNSVTAKLFTAFNAQVVVKEKMLVFDKVKHEDAMKQEKAKLQHIKDLEQEKMKEHSRLEDRKIEEARVARDAKLKAEKKKQRSEAKVAMYNAETERMRLQIEAAKHNINFSDISNKK